MSTHNFLHVSVTIGNKGTRLLSLGELTFALIAGPGPDENLTVDGCIVSTDYPKREIYYPWVTEPATKANLLKVHPGDSLLVSAAAAECLLHGHLHEAYHLKDTVRLFTVLAWKSKDTYHVSSVQYEGQICLNDIRRLGV